MEQGIRGTLSGEAGSPNAMRFDTIVEREIESKMRLAADSMPCFCLVEAACEFWVLTDLANIAGWSGTVFTVRESGCKAERWAR
jgi:hypothetical protein